MIDEQRAPNEIGRVKPVVARKTLYCRTHRRRVTWNLLHAHEGCDLTFGVMPAEERK